MPRDLLLLRNGKAETAPPRPLKDNGKRQVQRIGVWLAGQNLLPDEVLAVPSERAHTSAQKALKAGGIGAGCVRREPRLKSGGLKVQLDLLRGLTGTRPMIVAHRRVVERLARRLSGRADLTVGTGTLVHFALPDDRIESAELRAVIRPEDLPARFPYPGPGGDEWRDRPAYYYRQSAVIPYRLGQNGLEILVITSSRRNHWLVPKGIHDPGLTAQESAAHEAEEEAGVRGEVHKESLGHFDVEKWGATCRVEVFAMRVDRVLSDAAWEESHRSRLWVDPDEAVQHLKHAQLGRIVRTFAGRFAS